MTRIRPRRPPRAPRPRSPLLLATGALFALLLLCSSALAADRSAGLPDDLDVALSYFVPEDAACRALFAEATEGIGRGAAEVSLLAGCDSSEAARVLRREILGNLKEKIDLATPGLGRFPLTSEEILRTVVEYEVFKMRTFLSSGVFPKRYFGYVDRKWDTAREEWILLRNTHAAVQAVNEHQRARGRSVRVSDLEVLVTYLAEGGALLFREKKGLLADGSEKIDPGRDLGCDNLALALERYRDLARVLDRRLGTRLAETGREEEQGARGVRSYGIGRRVSFRESVPAVALMYLYEKELAAGKLANRRKARGGEAGGESWPTYDLAALSLDEQFVAASLVFNTGMLFSPAWSDGILDFRTVQRLHVLSRENASKKGSDWRPPLPVPASPGEAFREVAARGYPRQPTAWQGAYHVLQRYGAFTALRDFTDLFDGRGAWKGH